MKTNSILSMTMMASVLAISFSSCSKCEDEDVITEYQAKVMVKNGETKDLKNITTNKNSEGTISRTGNKYSLRNFRQMKASDPAVPEETYYFDFKENDAVSATDKAPLTLVATQRVMDVKSNVAEGYTLFYVDKAFDLVTKGDQGISLTDNKAGIVTTFSPAGTIGWADYVMTNHTIQPIQNRTFVLVKSGTPYFKFQVRNIYSNETPNKTTAPDNYVYYSIDYQEFK